jgi:hypothetical protein
MKNRHAYARRSETEINKALATLVPDLTALMPSA